MRRRTFFFLAASTTTAAHAQPRGAGPRLTTVTRDLEQPWGIAFPGDGRILVTERAGRVRLIEGGRLNPRPVEGVPAVRARQQGGLLDICLHPEFARNRVLYLSYSSDHRDGSATAVARAEWADGRLRDVTPIFEALPRDSGGLHFGSRIAFDRAGLMYVTTGERYRMQRAQRLDDLAGKVVRLRDDGTVPPDNPFVGRPDARPEIFSWGHRNPQGLAMHPATGRMWLVEHGPRGGDELNLLSPGANYGWPLATHGIDYSGRNISDNKSLPGMVDPVRAWVPSISPCGLCFYTGVRYPGWNGSLFTGALSDFALHRLSLEGERVAAEERLLVDRLPYIRDVRQGPDGLLYLVTHSDEGGLYRLDPA